MSTATSRPGPTFATRRRRATRPRPPDGCTIFVKLWQFDPDDRHQMRVDTNSAEMAPVEGQAGVTASVLFRDSREVVSVESWKAGVTRVLRDEGGVELLVLKGDAVLEGGEPVARNAWLRVPADLQVKLTAGADGARVWLKQGHLPFAKAPAAS